MQILTDNKEEATPYLLDSIRDADERFLFQTPHLNIAGYSLIIRAERFIKFLNK